MKLSTSVHIIIIFTKYREAKYIFQNWEQFPHNCAAHGQSDNLTTICVYHTTQISQNTKFQEWLKLIKMM